MSHDMKKKPCGPSSDRRGVGMIIAGGGTGGHLFPGIAIAEEFLRRDPANRILFIGTERGLEKKILGELGFPLRTLKVEGLKGRGPVRILASLLKIPGSLIASFRILRTFQPAVVVGVGGYASGPAVLAARLLGLKTAIAEQNAFPGHQPDTRSLRPPDLREFPGVVALVSRRPNPGHRKPDPYGLPRG